MQSSHRWYLEHISLKQLGCRATLFPACQSLTHENAIFQLFPGIKYRLHVYCDPNTKIDEKSFIRFKSFNGIHSASLQLSKESEKRFKQNFQDEIVV